MSTARRLPARGKATRRGTLLAVVAVVASIASSCSSSSSITEANAPNTTVPGPPVESVAFELVGERGGPRSGRSTGSPAGSEAAEPAAVPSPTESSTPPAAFPIVSPGTPPTTVVAAVPPPPSVTPNTKPASARPTVGPVTPPPKVRPTIPAPSTAPPPANATRVPPTTAVSLPATPMTTLATTATSIAAPTTMTASLPPTAAPTTRTPTAVAVAGASCRRSQLGQQRRTKTGGTVQCEARLRKRRWTPVTTVAPPTTLVTAPTLGPGFDGTTIRIGLLTTTTHPVWGTLGRAISAGIEARVAAINRAGGINGRYPIVVVKGETNYDPAETLNQIQATKANVALYVSLLGTPSTEAAEPLLRGEGLVASPASQEARWANSPTLLPVFNSYQVQAINGVAYFAEQFALSNPGVRPVICAVSVGTSFGDAGSEGIRAAAAALPVTLGPIVTLAPSETSFVSAIGALKAAGCHAVFLTVTPLQTLGMVVTGRQLSLATRWIIMGASFSDRIVTPQTGPLFEQGAWVVGDGTQWGDESAPGMTQMKAELLASDNRFWTENPDVGLSFGWAQARTIEQVLEVAVAKRDLSRAGILAASRATGPVALGGIGSMIDYSQAVRLANAKTTIFIVDNSYRNAIKVLAREYGSPAAAAYRR